MSDSARRDLAIQTYCLRGYTDSRVVAQKVADLGLAHVELHAGDPDVFLEAGIGIVSTGVTTLSGDADAMRATWSSPGGWAWAWSAPTSGRRSHPRRSAPPSGWRASWGCGWRCTTTAAATGWGPRPCWSCCSESTGPEIGVMLDTAWAIDARADPVELARLAGDRLYGVHVKDFVYREGREPIDVVVGTGNLDMPGLAAALDDIGFDGPLILEYEGEVDNPMPALAKCVEAMRTVW